MDCFSMGRIDDSFNLFNYEIIERITDQHYRFKITFNDSEVNNTINRFHIRHGGVQSLIIDHISFSVTDELLPFNNCITTKMSIDYYSMFRNKTIFSEVVLKELNKDSGYFIVSFFNDKQKLLTQERLEFHILKKFRKVSN